MGWYCVRSKPKHEQLAAKNLRSNLRIELFNPLFRVKRATKRGVVHFIEPLFPCYLFVRCVIEDRLNEIRYTTGVSGIVHFGHRLPSVPEAVIEELRACFEREEPLAVDDGLSAGTPVAISNGPFLGFSAVVLRDLPAKRRVQLLLEILGRPTAIEVDRDLVAPEDLSAAKLLPSLAANRSIAGAHLSGLATAG